MIDPLDEFLGYRLRRASGLMMADLAQTLEPTGLRATEASVLLAIAANPDSGQSDIGRLLGIQRANMTPIIAALLARELVDRSASDGRSHSLRLNAAGEVLAADVKARIITHEARFTRDLDPAERVVLLEQLRKVGGRRL